MRPDDASREIFDAFSRITGNVFRHNRLLSCPTLSKAPNYGQAAERFRRKTPIRPLSVLALARIVLRYVAANFGHLGFMVLTWVYIRVLGWKMPESTLRDPDKRLIVLDTFAVLPRIAGDGEYRELYMPGLERECQARGHNTLTLYRLYGSRHPRELWRAMLVLSRRGGGLTEAHLLTASDWLALAGHCFAYPVALYRLIRSLGRFPAHSPEAYIREALLRTAGQCVLIGEARRLAGYRLGLLLGARPHAIPVPARGHRSGPGTALISWYENQTVNKCLLRGLSEAEQAGARHVPSIGAQLFIWPASLLNNHPDDGEAALGLAPDLVLVSGPRFLPEASRQHYAVGPSLRYGEMFAPPLKRHVNLDGDSDSMWGSAPHPARGMMPLDPHSGASRSTGDVSSAASDAAMASPLLVLLSYHPEEVRRVLQMLLPFAERGAKLRYKFHPATRPEHFVAWLPNAPELVRGTLKSALQSVFYQNGMVLGSGSGSLAEAVVMGIPVLHAGDAAHGHGLNYLPDYGKGVLWEEVSRGEDMPAAMRVLRAGLRDPRRVEMTLRFRDLLFTEPTPERIADAFGL
jgi:hypothetical protein